MRRCDELEDRGVCARSRRRCASCGPWLERASPAVLLLPVWCLRQCRNRADSAKVLFGDFEAATHDCARTDHRNPATRSRPSRTSCSTTRPARWVATLTDLPRSGSEIAHNLSGDLIARRPFVRPADFVCGPVLSSCFPSVRAVGRTSLSNQCWQAAGLERKFHVVEIGPVPQAVSCRTCCVWEIPATGSGFAMHACRTVFLRAPCTVRLTPVEAAPAWRC